jgi:D-alanyl-D-alanine carboxypeptidase
VKTGYIRASGFNLVTSAQRQGHRLVGVVMGGTSGAARDKAMIAMLDQTFAQLSSTGTTHAKAAPGRSADAEKPDARPAAETGQGDCSGAGCR